MAAAGRGDVHTAQTFLEWLSYHLEGRFNLHLMSAVSWSARSPDQTRQYFFHGEFEAMNRYLHGSVQESLETLKNKIKMAVLGVRVET